MRRKRRTLLPAIGPLILLFCQGMLLADRPMVAPYREYTREGASIDWLAGRAKAHGMTEVIWEKDKRKIPYLKVRQRAVDAGRDALMELLGGIRVDSGSTLEETEGAMDGLRVLLEQATTTSTPHVPGSKMSITVEVPLWGERGLVSLLMPRIDSPDPQSSVTELAPASLSRPSGPAAIQASEEGAVTGLVIDATRLTGPEAALFGRVIDDTGRVVHAVEEADFDAVREHGLMAYAIKITSGTPVFRTWVREGADHLHVEAVALGASGTDLIISSADADRVLQADASSPFLRQCRVLVMMRASKALPRKPTGLAPKPPEGQKNKAPGTPL